MAAMAAASAIGGGGGELSSLVGAAQNHDSEKENGSKKGKKKKKDVSTKKEMKRDKAKAQPVKKTSTKTLVEELKLFQNNQLLNQQDPIQQLQIQLNQIMEDGDNIKSKKSSGSKCKKQNNVNNNNNCLSSELHQNTTSEQQQQQQLADLDGAPNSTLHPARLLKSSSKAMQLSISPDDESMSTIKKGVLWQQQQHDKFHQRLFSIWKKRYFILTTDYLVCFKRSSSKVGHSEMGRFLYKTSLNDVTKLAWSRPKKSDKGVIILTITGQFDLYLWSKNNLNDWMLMISNSIERFKIRKSHANQSIISGNSNAIRKDTHVQPLINDSNDLYENTAIAISNDRKVLTNQHFNNDANHSKLHLLDHSSNMVGRSSHSNELQVDNTRGNTITKYSTNSNNNQSEEITNGDENKLPETKGENEKSKEEFKSKSSTAESDRLVRKGGKQKSEIEKKTSQSNNVGDKKEIFEVYCSDKNINTGEANEEAVKKSARKNNNVHTSGRVTETEMINGSADNDVDEGKQMDGNQSIEVADEANATLKERLDIDREKGKQFEQDRTQKEQSNNLSSDLASQAANGLSSISSTSAASGSSPTSRCNTLSSAASASRSETEKTKSSRIKLDEAQKSSKDKRKKVSERLEDNKVVCKKDKNRECSEQVENRIGEGESKAVDEFVQETKKNIPKGPPQANLIRRDDSWQSLVSLTNIGRETAMKAQAVQRSLYAQHIMPEHDQHGINNLGQNSINIESTMTPNRGPLLRQRSVQIATKRILRPLGGPHAASFDMDTRRASPTVQPMATSHQQKLLQLKLLNNNIDYIRESNNNGDDYGIYGPESSIANPYGYSSMRSNLKSAASEFSFIRPSATSYIQSTLPHKQRQSQTEANDNNNTRNQPIRSSLVLPKTEAPAFQRKQHNYMDGNNNEIGCFPVQNRQFLVHPVTGERIINQQALLANPQFDAIGNANGTSDLMAPMRDLPLKPNKKRSTLNTDLNGSHSQKTSSLTSSIACFFRRAFSRRSKRRKKGNSKLADSCSSSLGAFGDVYANLPVIPSAFSTGSKSVDGNNRGASCSKGQQPQRMIDMIEAFTNQTIIADGERNNIHPRESLMENIGRIDNKSNATPMRNRLNQFGSPLHKSNSISTTIGLSQMVEARSDHKTNFIHDNDVNASVCGASPMMLRSSKVMSANLTPLMLARRETNNSNQEIFMSPRIGSRQESVLPRPSSIYGQPSMISSSPMITREDRNVNNNFGLHRNSLNSHNNYVNSRDRGAEARRAHHQIMKTSYLDTTREVAEELSSPTNNEQFSSIEDQANHASRAYRFPVDQQGPQVLNNENSRYYVKQVERDTISASPSSGRLITLKQSRQRQAIVNPILQSPTMDTIYDNHPMLNGNITNETSYSHYDNHNQLLLEQQQHHHQSPSLRSRSRFGSNSMMQFLPSSPMAHDAKLVEHQSQSSNLSKLVLSTPSRGHLIANGTESDRKPSAIVSPSTIQHDIMKNNYIQMIGSPNHSERAFSGNHQQNAHLIQSRSPMLSRRVITSNYQQTSDQYQQSPLISQQTRILNKKDGVQATLVGNNSRQCVVNIAGAPGINLEPSLAASLLRGTNIDAYESSTFDRLSSNSSEPASSNTFLVSTRLSKSMAYSKGPSSNDLPSSSSPRNGTETPAAIKSSQKRSPLKEEELESSSSSRSENSSHISLKARVMEQIDNNNSSGQEDRMSSDSAKFKKASGSSGGHRKLGSKSESAHRKGRRRESSNELSDEISSSNTESLEKDHERNWITSKLVN